MKTSLAMFAVGLVLTVGAKAQESSAESVQTNGWGELLRASELMIAPAGQGIAIRLPATVRTGEIIYIQYGSAGNTVTDSFMVTAISIKGDTCALENKRNTAVGKELSDMIQVRSCRKLK